MARSVTLTPLGLVSVLLKRVPECEGKAMGGLEEGNFRGVHRAFKLLISLDDLDSFPKKNRTAFFY